MRAESGFNTRRRRREKLATFRVILQPQFKPHYRLSRAFLPRLSTPDLEENHGLLVKLHTSLTLPSTRVLFFISWRPIQEGAIAKLRLLRYLLFI
jgi:hypothetical protein